MAGSMQEPAGCCAASFPFFIRTWVASNSASPFGARVWRLLPAQNKYDAAAEPVRMESPLNKRSLDFASTEVVEFARTTLASGAESRMPTGISGESAKTADRK